MIIMKRDGSLLLEELDMCVPSDGNAAVELPASLVLRDSGVIDRFLMVAFEVLRFRDIRVRVYEDEPASVEP